MSIYSMINTYFKSKLLHNMYSIKLKVFAFYQGSQVATRNPIKPATLFSRIPYLLNQLLSELSIPKHP